MKTLLADDHRLMREGVRQVLTQLEPAIEIIDAHDYPSLFAQTAQHADLDLALVNLNMPGFVGMQGITQYRHRFPIFHCVVLSASESPHDIRSALEAGALGYIPKAASTAVMLAALRQVLAGHLLHVVNQDSVAHDLQFYKRDREYIFIMFHRPALTKTGTSDVVRFTGNRRGVTMQCGMHPYMQGHGLAVENPYYAITGLEGTFSIKVLPAGTYRIKAWHPILGVKEQTVTVTEQGSTSVGFTFEAK